VRLEHRKNARQFPVLLASHQRFVGEGVAGQACANKKTGARPVFLDFGTLKPLVLTGFVHANR
jgi:hypothetical protein